MMLSQRAIDLDAAIEQSRGGVAALWEYSGSLSELTIRIGWNGKSENIHLVCNGCIRIEATASWGNVNLEYHNDEGGFKLVDRDAQFSVICGQIRMFRNVGPRFVEQ
jgi:hypothetical protein